jgi:hypothetical protein
MVASRKIPHPALSRWERERDARVSVVTEKTSPCEPSRGEDLAGATRAAISDLMTGDKMLATTIPELRIDVGALWAR